MNRADVLAKFVGCDRRIELLVTWIVPPPPPRGSLGAVSWPGVVGVIGDAGGVRRQSDRSFARLNRGDELELVLASRDGKGEQEESTACLVGRGEVARDVW